jgi:hypothetical protein
LLFRVLQSGLVLCLLGTLASQEPAPNAVQSPATVTQPEEKPRVFITDSESWEIQGSAAGSGGTFAAGESGGARPQTAEIIKTFGQRCPAVIVNNRQDMADYIVVLDHEGGKGYLRHKNKVAVFEHLSGDAVISHSTLSVGGSVEDACNGIVQHWALHSKELLTAREKPPAGPLPPASPTSASSVPAQPIAQASLSVDSSPAGADIEVDGGFVGSTPSTIAITSGSHEVSVTKAGYAAWTRKLNVTGGNIHLSAELEHQAAQ